MTPTASADGAIFVLRHGRNRLDSALADAIDVVRLSDQRAMVADGQDRGFTGQAA